MKKTAKENEDKMAFSKKPRVLVDDAHVKIPIICHLIIP